MMLSLASVDGLWSLIRKPSTNLSFRSEDHLSALEVMRFWGAELEGDGRYYDIPLSWLSFVFVARAPCRLFGSSWQECNVWSPAGLYPSLRIVTIYSHTKWKPTYPQARMITGYAFPRTILIRYARWIRNRSSSAMAGSRILRKAPGAFINLNECRDPPGPVFDFHKVHGNDWSQRHWYVSFTTSMKYIYSTVITYHHAWPCSYEQ